MAVEPALLQRALRPQKSSDDPLWALQFLTDREWQVKLWDDEAGEIIAKIYG